MGEGVGEWRLIWGGGGDWRTEVGVGDGVERREWRWEEGVVGVCTGL